MERLQMTDISDAVALAKKLCSKNEYEQALSICEKALSENAASNVFILRERAHIYTIIGDHICALDDWMRIIEDGNPNSADFYQAGESALFASAYDEAERAFKFLIEKESQDDFWFSSSAKFLLSYTKMMKQSYDEAISLLEEAIEMDSELSISVPDVGMVTAAQLLKEIERRKLGR